METKLTITKKGIIVIEYIIDNLVIGLIEGIKSGTNDNYNLIKNIYNINNLYVSIAYRRHGYGTRLIVDFAKYIYEKEQNAEIFILLDDCTGHDPKNNIYSKLGFLTIHENDERMIPIHDCDFLSEKRIIKIKNLLKI